MNARKRIVLLLIIVPLFVLYIFKAFHLQGIPVLSYSLVLSLAAYIYSALNNRSFKNEIGFLSIMGAEVLLRISLLF